MLSYIKINFKVYKVYIGDSLGILNKNKLYNLVGFFNFFIWLDLICWWKVVCFYVDFVMVVCYYFNLIKGLKKWVGGCYFWVSGYNEKSEWIFYRWKKYIIW